MHVSVTTLGAEAGALGRAVDQIVGYLEGDQTARSQQPSDSPSRVGSQGPDTAPLAAALERPEAGGYYADSADAAGRWRGSGAGPEGYELGEVVAAEQFRRVLLGEHPHSGVGLVAAQGSSGRAGNSRRSGVSMTGPADEMLTSIEAAELVGVYPTYITRLAAKTVALRAEAGSGVGEGEVVEMPATYINGTKDERGRWQFERGEVERFMAARKQPQVVLGYDVTWSAPKSVSALYAQGDDRIKEQIDEAIEAAVSVGMAYLETEGFHVRSGRGRERASEMVAASYRHRTNRALEPQLHEHVVVANMATTSTGEVRTVDARGLYAHATSAGYLAAAELRLQLSDRLGVRWADVYKGLADIAGVDRSEIMAISSRRQDVLSLSAELGFTSPQARQAAALATRPGKDHSVEAADLQARWKELLSDAGLTEDKVAGLLDRGPTADWLPGDTEDLFGHLGSHRGVTEQQAIFDRRDVIMAIAEQAVDRLSAGEILDLADRWLTTDAVVPLEITDGARRETIGHGPGVVSLAPDEQRFTTPQMIAIDQRVTDLHQRGLGAGRSRVPALVVERAINAATSGGFELGADQAAMVRAITTSGDQFQAVVGMAGAGKTTATRTAVHAWREAGFEVIGAAPFGEAARNLENETGLRSQTLEGLLTRIELAGDPRDVIGPNTVIVVDEASTIGNRQLDRLYRAAAETGATVRTIGDPHQHQSVEAGGLWQHLVDRFADHTPVLEENRRQTGPDMGQVRVALDEYREGQVAAALQRLDGDDRIVTAHSWDGLLDAMAADWYVDHRRHLEDGSLPSRMIAERNSDRHALNTRAQDWLSADGTLGAGVRIGGARFHVGDRVVAQTKDPDLLAAGADRRDHVINGSQGTVIALTGPHKQRDLIVEFDGLGIIQVPHEFIATEVGPGRGGGLSPAYAVTSYKAEGQTYDAGRNLAAPGEVHLEGLYVALTRGRNDQRIYSIAPANRSDEQPELPTITDERAAVDALVDGLTKPRGADLATVADPNIAEVATLATTRLDRLGTGEAPEISRARTLAESRIAAAAIASPDPVTVAALGPRPPRGLDRDVWDRAVGEAAIYRARWNVAEITPDGGVPQPAAGQPPEQFDHYDAVTAAVRDADQRRLESQPLHQLLTEREQLGTALDSIGDRDEIGPITDAAIAARELADARATHDRATRRVQSLTTGPTRRRVNPNDVETARQRAETASRGIAAARRSLTVAQQRLAAVQGSRPAQDKIRARAAAIDRAIDRRIATATRRPADYLNEALGPRPPLHGKPRDRWHQAAAAVENYRHRHLGLSPTDGPMPGTGRDAAIGPEPKPGPRRTAWRDAKRLITQHTTGADHERPGIDRPARRIT